MAEIQNSELPLNQTKGQNSESDSSQIDTTELEKEIKTMEAGINKNLENIDKLTKDIEEDKLCLEECNKKVKESQSYKTTLETFKNNPNFSRDELKKVLEKMEQQKILDILQPLDPEKTKKLTQEEIDEYKKNKLLTLRAINNLKNPNSFYQDNTAEQDIDSVLKNLDKIILDYGNIAKDTQTSIDENTEKIKNYEKENEEFKVKINDIADQINNPESQQTDTTQTKSSKLTTFTLVALFVAVVLVMIAVVSSITASDTPEEVKKEEQTDTLDRADIDDKLKDLTSLENDIDNVKLEIEKDYNDFSLNTENKYVSANELSPEARAAMGAGEGTMVSLADVTEYYLTLDKRDSLNDIFPNGFNIQEREMVVTAEKQTYTDSATEILNFRDTNTEKEYIKVSDLNQSTIDRLKIKPEETFVPLSEIKADFETKLTSATAIGKTGDVAQNDALKQVFKNGNFDIYKNNNTVESPVHYRYYSDTDVVAVKNNFSTAIKTYIQEQNTNNDNLEKFTEKQVDLYRNIQENLAGKNFNDTDKQFLKDRFEKDRYYQDINNVKTTYTASSVINRINNDVIQNPIAKDNLKLGAVVGNIKMYADLHVKNLEEVTASKILNFDGKFYDTHKADTSAIEKQIADINSKVINAAKNLDNAYTAHKDLVDKSTIRLSPFQGGVSTANLTATEYKMTQGEVNLSELYVQVNKTVNGKIVTENYSLQSILKDPEVKFEDFSNAYSNFEGVTYGTMGEKGFQALNSNVFNQSAVNDAIKNQFLNPIESSYTQYTELHGIFKERYEKGLEDSQTVKNDLYKLNQNSGLDDEYVKKIQDKLTTLETITVPNTNNEYKAVNTTDTSIFKQNFNSTVMNKVKEDYLNKIQNSTLLNYPPLNNTTTITQSQVQTTTK